MSKGKQVSFRLSGKVEEMFDDICSHIWESDKISYRTPTSESEVVKMCIRGFHRIHKKVKPDALFEVKKTS